MAEEPKMLPPGLEKLNPYFTPAAIVVAGIIIAGAVIYSGGGFKLPGGSDVKPAKSTSDSQTAPVSGLEVTSEDHIRGNPDAKVTIVEFSDLQCPFCNRFHPTVKQILENYPGQVRWAYKHFPLDSIHPEARPSAEASECVWEQKGEDGFWTFVDGVFVNQNRMDSELYRELAGQIGVNMNKFDDCVVSRKYQDKVEEQYQQGLKAGVRGTPGSFVNGTPVSGAVPYSSLEAEVKRALDQ